VDHITAMRKVVPVTLVSVLLLACCGTPTHWEKPGVSSAMTATDAVDCRRAASMEAFLYQPRLPPPLWPYRRPSWKQLEDSERFYAENRLTAFCMRSKGYELVPIPKSSG
jgi:hypothetical protein